MPIPPFANHASRSSLGAVLLLLLLLLQCRWDVVGAVNGERFPNKRRLTSDFEDGRLENFVHIQFSKPIVDSELQASSSILDEQQLALDLAADQILSQLPGCTTYTRLFRHAGKFEMDHVQAGLNQWYEFYCPPEDLKGQGTYEAIQQLTLLDEELISQGSTNIPAIYILHVEPDYALEDLLLKNDDEPITWPIDESHTMLRQSTDADNSTQARQRALNTHIPNDPMLNEQANFDAINLRDAWKFMEETNSWPRAKDVIVHVSDSGWDLSHEDLGGKHFHQQYLTLLCT